MSGGVTSLVGTPVSGSSSKLETHGDLEPSSSPYHNPSPSGSFIVFERDMSDNCNPLDDEEDTIRETSNEINLKNQRKRDKRIRIVHRHLNKEIDETHQFSEESEKRLARIARIARYEYRASAEKRLKHLEWAAKTLTPVAFTPYVRMFRIDAEMSRLLEQLGAKEESNEGKSTEASILKSLAKMSESKKFRKLRELAIEKSREGQEERDTFDEWALTLLDEAHRTKYRGCIGKQPRKIKKQELMSRPLAEIPFNTAERKLVEGLLSLLMRTSESVARRPWPQISRSERQDRDKFKEIRRNRQAMERDERLLDQLRGRIELGWQNYVKTPFAGPSKTSVLIDKVRALDEDVLGFNLLPSTTCILAILKIIKNTSAMEVRLPAKDRCAMSSELMEDFEDALRTMDLYDDWRATNPPDSERFLDFLMAYWRGQNQNS